jgi:formylglycine-generating enzyme required for sulfatase activity
MKVVAAFVVAAAAAQIHAQAPALPRIEWKRIPAGSFQMGCVPADMRCDADERPRHMVTLTRPFELMATEVTKTMFAALAMLDDQPPWSTLPEHPVAIVDWSEAVEFCKAVGGRLPTEAEWEYAARGGRADSIYPWGDDGPDDREKSPRGAAFEGDSARAVGTFGPNGFGLFDMAGNVWEWVADAYAAYPAEAIRDPQRAETSQFRVVRGGAYGDDQGNLRLSNRTPNRARNINVNVGFRCARDVAS